MSFAREALLEREWKPWNVLIRVAVFTAGPCAAANAQPMDPEPRGFVQCHRAYLANLNEARSLLRYELTLSDGMKVPVSKQRYQEVRAALEDCAAVPSRSVAQDGA